MNVINTPKSIAIDFDSNEIRVVEGRVSKKGIIINKSISISIPNDIYEDGIIEDMDQLIYLLKTGLSENKITSGNTYAIINSSKIILREVLFPKVDANDIDNLIKYQLGDYIPIHPEDYVVKYIDLGTFLDNGVEKMNLLLIGVPINIVESHFNLLSDAGLKPLVLDYKGNAICKLISFSDTINSQYNNNSTIAFIDLGHDNIGLTIVKDNQIKVSRIVEGKLDMDEPMESLKDRIHEILDRIEMIFRYYRTREIGNNIDLVILHGDMSQINEVEELFASFFDVPCIKLNTLSKIKFDGELSLYANAIGGLIRLGGVKK